jgi:hypothetical protein
MPDVLVEVKGFWLGEQKSQFLDAIHAALVETFRTPPGDKVLRLVEYAAEDFLTRGRWVKSLRGLRSSCLSVDRATPNALSIRRSCEIWSHFAYRRRT